MNTIRKWTFAASVLAILLTACSGVTARREVLLPAIRTAWGSVRIGVEREVAAQHHPTGAAELAKADEALAAGVAARVMAVDWLLLEQLADADIERRTAAGEVSAGVAVSLRERITQLNAARKSYAQR
jgi:hypothetical protein